MANVITRLLDRLYLRRASDGAIINPATEETLQAVFDAVDGLELSVDNIDIDLDDVEVLITATNAALAELNSNVGDVTDPDTFDTVVGLLKALKATLLAFKAEAHSDSGDVQAAIVAVQGSVDAFKAAFDARDLATETTQASAKAEAHQDSLDEQAAQAATTSAIDTDVGLPTDPEATGDGSAIAILKRLRTRLDALISTFSATDFATETTLAAFKAANHSDLLALQAANDASGDDIVSAIQALEAANDASGDDIVSAVQAAQSAIVAAIAAHQASNESDLATANAHLAAIEASTGIMDDWDEADRAKVNPIVGQAGIEGGAGAVSAKTTRVTLTTEQEAILSAILANNRKHSRDANNEQTSLLGASGVFNGTFTKIDEIDHTEILYASTAPFTAKKIWSNDGINPLGGDFGESALTVKTIASGALTYYVVYDVTEGRNVAPYYRLQVTNGATPQSAYPLTISIAWLIKTPYTGAYQGVDEEPSQLTRALVTKQFHQKTSRLTSTPLGAGGTFTTVGLGAINNQTPNAQGYFAATNWAAVDIHVFGSPNKCPGTLYFYFSHDGITDHIGPVPVVINDLTQAVPLPLRNYAYWRVTYTNGSVPQTAFGIFVTQRATISDDLTRLLTQVIGPAEPVKVVRALVEPSLRGERGLLGADKGVFGAAITANRSNQVEADYSRTLAQNRVGSTVSGTGATAQANGQATISTGSGTTSSARLQSVGRVTYSPGSEIYAIFTARFTTPTHASSYQRIGIYDDNNGFWVGYNGLTFGFGVRSATVDTFTALTSANGDPLDGTANSRFSRGNQLEALDPTKLNVYRIRFGWLGSSIVDFEVQSPDGAWMLAHRIRQPNTSTTPHIQSPNLPMRSTVSKTSADATNLVIGSGSWAAGVSTSPSLSDFSKLLQRVLNDDDEMRLDVEPTNTDYYIGISRDGTATSAAEWNVARIYLSATKNPNRMRFRQGVVWDSRSSGWT